MMEKTLPEVCIIQYGFPFDSSKFCSAEGVPLVRIRDVVRGYSETYTTEIAGENYIVNDGDLLIGMDGEFNIAYWKGGRAYLNQRVCRLIPREDVDRDYIFYYMPQALKAIEDATPFVTVKHLSAKQLSKILIPLPDMSEQQRISAVLRSVDRVIAMRKKELDELNNLVKSRFIELFGDPVANPHGFDKVALSELADIKIGPFGSLLHKEDYIEGGHALLNPSHIIDGKVAPDYKLTVSAQKYEELSAYHLKADDVVMGRRGEMGRCAVVPCDGYLCGTGSLMIRTKGEVTADYIQKIISFPSFKKTIEDMAVGQTMPNLNVPIVSNFQIIKPPIEVQKSYYTFVEQTDKSKLAVQQGLQELEILKKSLMQQYFG